MDEDALPETHEAIEALGDGHDIEVLDDTPVNLFVSFYSHDEGRRVTRNFTNNYRNELLFKYGMYDLVHGDDDTIIVLNQDPYAAISSYGDATYTVWVGDEYPVRTAPSMEERVLEAVRDIQQAKDADKPTPDWTAEISAEEDRPTIPLKEVHQHIIDTQVRRNVVNKLLDHQPFESASERGLVDTTDEGWVFHDELMLTWEGELRNNRDVGDFYQVEGSSVRRVDTANEAFTLRDVGAEFDDEHELSRHTVEFDDGEVTFGLSEMEFVTKAIWVLKNVHPRGATTQGN